jgi:hypothetical protein
MKSSDVIIEIASFHVFSIAQMTMMDLERLNLFWIVVNCKRCELKKFKFLNLNTHCVLS